VRLSLLLMAFGGSLAQSSVVPSWSVGGVTPDLPLILTALVALRRGPEAGCLVGFAAGLLQDATGTLAWLEFEQMGVDRVRVKRATATLRISVPMTGSLSSSASMVERPFSVR